MRDGPLDQAIGDFQKVLTGGDLRPFSPYYLLDWTLLVSSFMEKEMPAITARCHMGAPLEAPNLDPEGMFAIHYDPGAAFEEAGNLTVAVEKFIEVYSHNIYRGVAEEIRLLRQSAR